MNDETEKVRQLILTNKKPSYQTTNKREVRVRCPYCGDSRKNKNSAHLYIEMEPPFKFYCQRCSVGGALNSQTLRDLGIHNNDLSANIINANKTIKNFKNQKMQIKKYTPTLPTEEGGYSINALNYFNGRFMTNYSNQEIVEKFKAITNPMKFFEDNKIRVPLNKYNYPLYDFNNSIGFLSSDGSHVIFRDITNQQQRRYFNFNLFNDQSSTSNKLYNIKSSLDIMNDEITLVMTEGIFDIVGVYEKFYKDQENKNNHIFAAAAGKGFNAVIGYYVRMGLLNLNIVIYSDSDVDPDFYRHLKSQSIYLKNNRLTIYYNKLSKDFGVSSDQIDLRRVVV